MSAVIADRFDLYDFPHSKSAVRFASATYSSRRGRDAPALSPPGRHCPSHHAQTLLPRVMAVVHLGWVGTASAAARAGVPSGRRPVRLRPTHLRRQPRSRQRGIGFNPSPTTSPTDQLTAAILAARRAPTVERAALAMDNRGGRRAAGSQRCQAKRLLPDLLPHGPAYEGIRRDSTGLTNA